MSCYFSSPKWLYVEKNNVLLIDPEINLTDGVTEQQYATVSHIYNRYSFGGEMQQTRNLSVVTECKNSDSKMHCHQHT